MARIILPLEAEEKEELAGLSRDTGLSVGVLLVLRRRGYKVLEARES